MELRDRLKRLAEELGADFFAIANLSPAQELIENLWGETAAQFPRAISFGIALSHAIVDQQPRRFSSNVAFNYNHHAYHIINQRLDHIASRLSGILQKEGNRSLPIPSTHECVDICPVKAITGEPFREEDPREIRYSAHKCDKYLSKLKNTSALGVCGMCVYVCPYGRKMNNSRLRKYNGILIKKRLRCDRICHIGLVISPPK
jgi:NAD-dependent dihydropyrimidine dehydrogenase PreA subunit